MLVLSSIIGSLWSNYRGSKNERYGVPFLERTIECR
jgi:hypothetical protein